MNSTDPLSLFLPPVGQWFRTALGEPTPAQRQGWPLIASGRNTLILAPTGSGKTLAAFLACLDSLWRQPPPTPGVRVLYVSPLKALNNDVHRNLQVPLQGVADTARQMGQPLPELVCAVRTGDTSAAERQRLVRRSPHVLITTPESLHLLLTSRGRDTLRGVTHCIIDEIHALCGNKRGVFLALLLERLAALNQRPQGFVRIGLSATQRPLEEVAAYLGGREPDGENNWRPRPVAVVDAGLRKGLDLQVHSPFASAMEGDGPLERSVWPSIHRLIGEEIGRHRSTIVFANNRRTVERITAALNEEQERARAHHGSVSLEVRQQIEQALKEGRLPAVVATASLELGIDMGAVELVCQVESPGSVARGLQRVGRAGHLVGGTSKGRLIAKTPSDLIEQAVLAREMAAGRVEAVRVPINCLDVLAQQLVACAAMDDWDVPELYALVRRAYPYRDLSPEAFEATLEMVSGRYRLGRRAEGGAVMEALQPRASWDRVHNRLRALPGSQQMALVNGGTIPDTGQYAVHTVGGVRIGELDEEFIYERRVGDTFLLGTNAWRLEQIEADRVVVSPAEGAPAIVPFWRGENAGRSHDLGLAIGAFLRELATRLEKPDCRDWLNRDFFLDPPAARSLCRHVGRQLTATGVLPTDRTLLIEASRDQLGDWQVVLLSPLGSRLHLALRLALEARLQQRLGYRPQCLHHDDGLLIRLTDTDEPVTDLFAGLTPENVEGLILEELADSALFALRFRQNANRALLLPRTRPGHRAPLWLQRLRGRDLLQVARQQPDFPVVAETFRECLHDHLDVPRLRELLADVGEGRVQVVTRRSDAPCPFAADLLFNFTAAFVYQQDGVEPNRAEGPALDRRLLEQLVAPGEQEHLLNPRAVHSVERRLRGLGRPPRSETEMAEWLRRLGDLTADELEGPMASFLAQLEADGRARRIDLPGCRRPRRWIAAEDEELYRRAFGMTGGTGDVDEARAAAAVVFERFLATHALVGLPDVLDRYPFDPAWARRQLDEWVRAGRAVSVPGGDGGALQWSAPENLEQVQRGSLALLRREVLTCSPPQFAEFLLNWQGVGARASRPLFGPHAGGTPALRQGEARQPGRDGLAEALECLQGLPLDATLWEQVVLPGRVSGYQPGWLDEWVAGGSGLWVCQASGDSDGERSRGNLLAFFGREVLRDLPHPGRDLPPLEGDAARVLEILRGRGASFVADLAAETGLSPNSIRSALHVLLRRGLVTNDQFDVIRRGEMDNPPERVAEAERLPPPSLSRLLSARRRGGVARAGRSATIREGRWSVVPWGHPEPEVHAVACVHLLLQRYGIVARELALLDPWALPWRVCYEVLSRMELTGEVRRGYFVEGLSGAQFALPEAVELLQETHRPSTATAPAVLLHSQDPANLYGSGAPFDVPLLDGGTRPLQRRAGNWLVLRAGRPVLLAEQQGRRLTALPSASRDDVTAAVACLPGLLEGTRGAGLRKVTVEEWNGQPVTGTEGRALLEAVGFVRDYNGLTLYAGWR
jgi:ATP-dependent Lhr-like helicase